jgi:transposase InsO family protein
MPLKTAIFNKDVFESYTQIKTNMKGAGNNQIVSPGMGKYKLTDTIKLERALHVPDLGMNLLSVGQICDQGNTVTITKTCGTVTNNNSRKVVLRAPRTPGGVYIYTSKPEEVALNLQNDTTHKTTLAHRRLGHLNIPAVKLLGHLSIGLDLDGTPKEGCDSCALAKSHRRVKFDTSNNHATRHGELIHGDLGTFPSAVTVLGDYRYWLILVDDYSRYAFVYLLRKKSDATQCIIKYDKAILNRYKSHIGTIRVDKGKEFLGELKTYMEQHGIQSQTTAGYTSSQNGRAERPILTIMETALTLMFYSGLPMKFIGLAIETSVYLRNKCPHSALPKETPHYRWYGNKPDLTNLRVFGTVCYSHVPKQIRNKVDERSRRCYMLGYSDKAKAWKLYNIETGKIIKSAHVKFMSEDFNPNTETSHLNNYKTLIADLLPKEYFKRKEDIATLEQLKTIKTQTYCDTLDNDLDKQEKSLKSMLGEKYKGKPLKLILKNPKLRTDPDPTRLNNVESLDLDHEFTN